MEEFRPASQKLGDGVGVKSLMQSTGLGMIAGQVLVGQMYYSGYGVPNYVGWGEAPILPFVTAEDQKTAMAKASEACAFLRRCPSLTLGSMLEEIAAILPGHEFASISAGSSSNSCKVMVEVEKNNKRGHNNSSKQTVHRKSIETFGQRTSQYRGVTRHRWIGRYEAHLWDNSCKKEGQTRKGR
ncbi:AP2-like ethylene-responsive transcription factor AIL1 isoform X5 [Arachis ipaensis]|uniref:AP2-like ethylene-responsive transcription factor AIL1 isoform X5 n=1 Tax=Arachis ipaensis TaxID=130454 RepID=UPI000A2B3A9C|nr:AP2-like ethylene-responsive transcription factor AIL1 isoform X5 [Arachis ipaensis]